MYGKNILNFMQLIIRDGELNINFDDDLVKGTCIAFGGKITNEKVASLLS